jgi:hypothetical protein
MWPCESMEMVLMRPAEPVAGEGLVSERVGLGGFREWWAYMGYR